MENQLLEKTMAPRDGFEPPTNRLTAGCSTAELPGNLRARCLARPAGHGYIKLAPAPPICQPSEQEGQASVVQRSDSDNWSISPQAQGSVGRRRPCKANVVI